MLRLNQAYAQNRVTQELKTDVPGALAERAAQQDRTGIGWAHAGLAYLLTREPTNARYAWVRSSYSSAEMMRLANHAEQLGQDEEAVQIYDMTISLYPSLCDPWFYKGELFANQGLYEKALAQFQQGLINSTDGCIGSSDFYLAQGDILAFKVAPPQIFDAQILLDRAIERNDFSDNEKLIRAHFLKGETHRILEQTEDAIAEYQYILRVNKNHYWANIRLGQMIWKAEGDLSKAEQHIQLAIMNQSQEKGAYAALGVIYLKSGNLALASQMFTQVLNLDPNDQQAMEALDQIRVSSP